MHLAENLLIHRNCKGTLVSHYCVRRLGLGTTLTMNSVFNKLAATDTAELLLDPINEARRPCMKGGNLIFSVTGLYKLNEQILYQIKHCENHIGMSQPTGR